MVSSDAGLALMRDGALCGPGVELYPLDEEIVLTMALADEWFGEAPSPTLQTDI